VGRDYSLATGKKWKKTQRKTRLLFAVWERKKKDPGFFLQPSTKEKKKKKKKEHQPANAQPGDPFSKQKEKEKKKANPLPLPFGSGREHKKGGGWKKKIYPNLPPGPQKKEKWTSHRFKRKEKKRHQTPENCPQLHQGGEKKKDPERQPLS